MGTDLKDRRQAPAWSGDLWGGLAAMLVALPSSVAFGILVFTSMGEEFAGQGVIAESRRTIWA